LKNYSVAKSKDAFVNVNGNVVSCNPV